jgi:LPXTG-motif cell wall-anchored protein
VLTSSKGEKRTLTVKPGEKKSEKFSATPGFTLTITAEGVEGSETIEYERPEDCDSSGGGAGEPELPLTGAAAGGIAGGAALLLAAGAFLFVMARRRKVKFTA